MITRTTMVLLVLACASGCEKWKDRHDDDGGDDAAAEAEGGDEDPLAELAVEGTVAKDPATAPFEGNDAAGTVYVAMFSDACGGTALVANTEITDVDLSTGASVPFLLEPVAPGHYFVTAFLDDNGDYDPADPGPNMGDIVMAAGAGPRCVEVDVVDADAEAAVVLNLALPFDPP